MKTLEYKLRSKQVCFQQKVRQSRSRIIKAMTGKVYVSWSGGKDSTVVLHLAKEIDPLIKVLHIRSGYELPDGYEYMLRIAQEWKLNFAELNTPMDYLELCEEYGLPHLRSKETQGRVISKIKKSPARDWALANNFDGLLWGIRAEESKARKAMAQYLGDSFVDKNGIRRVSPILDWSTVDVLAYHEYAGLEINPVYLHENCGMTRELIRNTGWLSTDGENRGRVEWLRKNYPVQFQKVRELL